MELDVPLPGCGLEDRGSSSRSNLGLEGSPDHCVNRDSQCVVDQEI